MTRPRLPAHPDQPTPQDDGDVPAAVFPQSELYETAPRGGERRHQWIMPPSVDPELAALLTRVAWAVSPHTLADYRPHLLNYWHLAQLHGRNPFGLDFLRDYIWSLAQPRVIYLHALEAGGRSRARGQEPGLGKASINIILAAVTRLFEAAGKPTPRDASAWRSWVSGVFRRLAQPIDRKSPLMRDDLIRALATTEAADPPLRGVRDRALLLLGWSCALRRSELTAIRPEDFREDGGGWHLWLPRSKTDQGKRGRGVPLYPSVDPRFDPLLAVRVWMTQAGIVSGTVFRGIDRHGHVLPGALAPESIRLIVKSYALRTNSSAHSLRAGFVSQAKVDGKDNFQIRVITRHTSDEMINLYARVTDARKQGPGSLL